MRAYLDKVFDFSAKRYARGQKYRWRIRRDDDGQKRLQNETVLGRSTNFYARNLERGSIRVVVLICEIAELTVEPIFISTEKP
jgi:hypothetical protein